MTPELLIGLGGLVLAVLTYFAGVQRGKRDRANDAAERAADREREDLSREREQSEARVARVTELYLANTLQVSNLAGALQAGVASLYTADEVKAFCDRVDLAIHSPVIPPRYRKDLSDSDLLTFFRELAQVPDWRSNEGRIFEIQERLNAPHRPAA